MKKAKSYAEITRRFYRPERYFCPECQRHLRRTSTLSQRKVVTLNRVIKVTHAGYRCPDSECAGGGRTYRSAAADALALPSFTFGLDVVVLAGQFHFGKHQTLDEAHQHISQRLTAVGVSISRREVLSLFEAFSTLLRAASDAGQDQEWREEVEKNKGIIVSRDGIKPDQGNETVYVVRDALTGRLLAADNVTDNSVERLKQLLMPVVALTIPVLGTISDAQETEVMALSQLWPEVPHQTCQFHALREASRPGFEEDSQMKAQRRKKLQPKIRSVRKQIHKQVEQASEAEAEQLAILDDYGLGVQTALNLDGKLPFEYAGVAAAEALDVRRNESGETGKKGEAVSKISKRKFDRLKQIVGEREKWREQIEQSKRMRQWVLDAEHILDGSWARVEELGGTGEQDMRNAGLTNKEVGLRFDSWRLELTQKLTAGVLNPTERECLEQFLQVLDNLRPHLIQCYDLCSFPRTNNETEGSIRRTKAR